MTCLVDILIIIDLMANEIIGSDVIEVYKVAQILGTNQSFGSYHLHASNT